MKIAQFAFTLFLAREIAGATLKNPPAFSTPLYSNSYLPATLQVTFHVAEQLRFLQMQEAGENTTSLIPTTKSHSPGQHQSLNASSIKAGNDAPGSERVDEDKDKMNEETTESSRVTAGINEETPEENQETPELNYATPETNYEMPEKVQSASENNEETTGHLNVNDRNDSSTSAAMIKKSAEAPIVSAPLAKIGQSEKKNASVDSVIGEVYGLVKPASKQSGTDIKFETDASEKSENLEEDEQEMKFTMLGEKVSQVPRPSLSSFLKRSKVPLKSSLQQLALLYDSLNKDARKQGYSKYTGYSDQVLKALETSASGGAGEQLKTLLEKTLQLNELTRDEAKAKAREILRDLANPASEVSRDLRRLLPLRYVL